MLNEIKNKVDAELRAYAAGLEPAYGLHRISPLLSSHIREYVLRPGKRVRSCLFVAAYLGYARAPRPGLYRTALAFEMLHNFMLIHDDIIDRSALRRGAPSMHAQLDRYLTRYRNLKFTGSDLGIVVADCIYAMAIEAFLAVRENPKHKEAALRKFTEAAVFTGAGEFVEMLAGARPIGNIALRDIYAIYDLKTAYYTFCAPLVVGSILAGAPQSQISLLTGYGIDLGRAFQINDDILDMCAPESQTGKTSLTDIKESKKTLLIWHAYRNAGAKDRRMMQRIFDKPAPGRKDMEKIRSVVNATGSVAFGRGKIRSLVRHAASSVSRLTMKKPYKELLSNLPSRILNA